jgi:PAS domain-containing protein
MHGSVIDVDELSGLCGAALDVLPQAILICDCEKILYANTAAARLLKATSADPLAGLKLDEFVHPDMHTPGGIRRQLLTKSRQRLLGLPAKVFARDGSVVTALTDARPIEYEGRVAILYSCTPTRAGGPS